jgi:hypothetical protein
VIAFAAIYWLQAPWPVLYGASVAAGAGITTVGASWYALLADATEGGRRGRRFGTGCSARLQASGNSQLRLRSCADHSSRRMAIR